MERSHILFNDLFSCGPKKKKDFYVSLSYLKTREKTDLKITKKNGLHIPEELDKFPTSGSCDCSSNTETHGISFEKDLEFIHFVAPRWANVQKN